MIKQSRDLEMLISCGRPSLSSWYWSANMCVEYSGSPWHTPRNLWVTSTPPEFWQDDLWFHVCYWRCFQTESPLNARGLVCETCPEFPHNQMDWKGHVLKPHSLQSFPLGLYNFMLPSRVSGGVEGFNFLYFRLLYALFNLIFYLETDFCQPASRKSFTMPSSDLLNQLLKHQVDPKPWYF